MSSAQNNKLIYKGYYKNYENNITGLSLAQCVCFSPDGNNCYIGSYDGFTWYAVDKKNKELIYKGTLVDGGNGGDGLSDGHAAAVSPDGKFVYLAAGYMENSVSVYTRNTSTGELTYKAIARNGDKGISNMNYPYGIDMDSK